MKTLIIMRGIPGSGKSTIAKNLMIEHMKQTGVTGVILSTDQQFMNGDNYDFDQSKLGWAHRRNQELAEEAMSRGTNLVIIDNTNLSQKERKPYIDFGKQYGYTIIVRDVDTPWAKDAVECYKRNTHNVPFPVIERMLEKLQNDINSGNSKAGTE